MMQAWNGIKMYKAFEAGFLATLVFHQGLLGVLHWLGPAPAPFNMSAVPPFGLPAVVSLAFWGGLWGILLVFVLRQSQAKAYWLRAVVLGSIGPSAVALFVVFPLKGLPLAGGWDPKIILGALMLNAAWGLGVGLWWRIRA